MKIKTVYLHNLRNAEHSELIRRIVEIIGRSGASELKVEAQLAAMTDALACEDEILVRISQSILTKRIKEADRERDDLYYGLTGAIRSAARHYTPAVRMVAEPLLHFIDTVGNITRMAFDEESSAMHTLCNNLEQRHAEGMATLGLTGWIDALRTANEKFQNLMIKRLEADAAGPKLAMADARAATDVAYNTLADVIFAYGLIASLGTDAALAEKYTAVIIQWNEAVERAENILATRRGKAAAKAAEKKKEEGKADVVEN